jgi:3-hydroxymyristoyl/3-hydroxydecanoyl-(acyl carrier protein) dehydratase
MMEFAIPAHHPALAGHFPGHPVVPAVVILDEVAARLPELYPGARIVRVTSAKFVGVLEPGQACRVSFERRADGMVRFACEALGRPVASGLLEIGGAVS